MISVIVPIYNVEALLPKCIESICNQTYSNLEIILVNDGSTDSCGDICEKYGKEDKRIIVINKENGGLSDARNAGLKLAKGEYIAFVDSDDFIVEDSYETLIEEAIENNLDIVVANALVIKENGNSTSILKKNISGNLVISGIDFMCQSIQKNSFHACVWMNLYKKELILENSLYFQKGLLHEDEEWTPRVFLEAKRVKYIDFSFYMYLIRDGSITNSKDKSQNAIDIINTCYKLEKIYKERLNINQRRILNNYLVNIYLGAVYLGRLDRPIYKKILRKSFVIGKSRSLKTSIKAILFIINIRLYSEVNRLSKV